MDQRLDAGEDETWLANVGLYPATTFCRLLGAELLRDGLRNSDISAHAAQAEGFFIASQGEAAIAGALRHLAMAPQGANDKPNKAYGDLYAKLSRDYVNDPAFSVFWDLLRKEILDIWPFAAGEAILGEAQPGRRLHSVESAARETGIGAPLLESLLIEAGSIAKDDSRPFRRKTYLADRYASLLTEIPIRVGPVRMCAELGATQAEFEALTEESLLSPGTKIPKVKEPWALQDATAFLFELQTLTNLINADAGLWETLLRAKV